MWMELCVNRAQIWTTEGDPWFSSESGFCIQRLNWICKLDDLLTHFLFIGPFSLYNELNQYRMTGIRTEELDTKKNF